MEWFNFYVRDCLLWSESIYPGLLSQMKQFFAFRVNVVSFLLILSEHKIDWMDLSWTKVSNKGVTNIHLCFDAFKGLKLLSLEGTSINDSCLKLLGGFYDQDFSQLSEFPLLEHLNLGNTKVTETGIQKLKCKI